MRLRKKLINFQMKKSHEQFGTWMIIKGELKMAPTMKNKKAISTVDEFLSDPKRKVKFEKEYSQFLLSEFLIEEMEKNKVSVRKLSDTTGISTSIIQNVKAMKTVNLTLKTIVSLIEPFGYELKIQKGKKSYVLNAQ